MGYPGTGCWMGHAEVLRDLHGALGMGKCSACILCHLTPVRTVRTTAQYFLRPITCSTLPARGATAGLPRTRAHGQHLDKALTMSSASSHGNAAPIRRWPQLHNSLHAVVQCMQRGLVQQPGVQPMMFMSRQGTAASPAASLPMLAPCYQERHALAGITLPLCSRTLRTR